jgi:hypothetical protein
MPIETLAAVGTARFLAGSPTPEQIIAFHPSPEATERFYALIEAEREGTLTEEERAELDRDIHLEYMMDLVKVEARKRLTQQAS